MSLKFNSGEFIPKNPEKYAAGNRIRYRSSWELSVMRMCDSNPAILQWASESIKIPYRDPLTGRPTVYVPDFFVIYVDKNNNKHAEIWEIKPSNQAFIEHVGKNKYNQAQYVKNMVKWAAARAYCQQRQIAFRILTEAQLFHTGKV